MGNQPSSSSSSGGQQRAHAASQGGRQSAHGALQSLQASRDLNPRRRASIHGLSVKATAAPPSASLESAARSQSTTTPHLTSSTTDLVANTLRAAHDSLFSTASDDKMGQEQSRPKSKHSPAPEKNEKNSPSPSARSKPPQSHNATNVPQSQPVNVPAPPREEIQASRIDTAAAAALAAAAAGNAGSAGPDTAGVSSSMASSLGPTPASQEDYFMPPSQFSRPPRLPLPIEEEVHTPGSPIISPADLAPIDLPRRASVLSSTTIEEDDLGDEFQGPQDVPTVPTLIEWEGPGERVYVTGTFAGWNRKFRLHRNGPSKKKDVLSAIVNIAPGTHHLKFIVDGDMTTSDKLPTAVDYTNILVNYLEVSLDDVPKPPTSATGETQPPPPVQELRAPPGIYPPQTLPPTPELLPVLHPVPEPPQPKAPSVTAPEKYHSVIPRYLLDLDASEESSRYTRANKAVNNLPTPPTLPMFLSKSILNGTTPHKDDSSVLIMPNHTVLNHLATSSIRDNILATSATTRYKQKFLTTIMYKPKMEDSGHVSE